MQAQPIVETSIEDRQTALKSFVPASFFFLFLLGSIWFGCPYVMLRDGATCRHLETGAYVLKNHAVPTTNYCWAIDPNYPSWLTPEILSDLTFALSYQALGLAGVVLVSGAVLVFSLLFAFQIARARGLGPITVWLFFVPVLIASTLGWSARAHIFSYLLFVLLYYVSFVSRSSLLSRTLWSLLISILWVNFHGSVMIGLAVLGARPAGELLTLALKRDWKSLRVSIIEFLPLVASALAICINLRGPSFYSYVFSVLGHPHTASDAGEWMPFSLSFGPGSWSFVIVIGLLLSVFLLSRWLPSRGEMLLLVVLGLASLSAMRFIPYFVLAGLLAVGPGWARARKSWLEDKRDETRHTPWPARATLALEELLKPDEKFNRMKAIVWSTVALAMLGYFIAGPERHQITFAADKLPVNCVDFLVAEKEKGKSLGLGFVFDNWSDYAYFRLRDKVFIDEKTQTYPPEFVAEYKRTVLAQPGWQKTLDGYNIQYVLVPKDGALATSLKHHPDWKMVREDGAGTLYFRQGSAGLKERSLSLSSCTR